MLQVLPVLAFKGGKLVLYVYTSIKIILILGSITCWYPSWVLIKASLFVNMPHRNMPLEYFHYANLVLWQ